MGGREREDQRCDVGTGTAGKPRQRLSLDPDASGRRPAARRPSARSPGRTRSRCGRSPARRQCFSRGSSRDEAGGPRSPPSCPRPRIEGMSDKARLVGINHVALEVGDIDEALAFYGHLFDFELRGRIGRKMAFLDAGDQFIALSTPRRQAADDARHFGLVVNDSMAMRETLEGQEVEILPGRGLDFATPGATESRSSSMTRSSSRRPRRRWQSSVSRGLARRRRRKPSCGRRVCCRAGWFRPAIPAARLGPQRLASAVAVDQFLA